MSMPGIVINKSMIRTIAVKSMIKHLDDYLEKESDYEFRERAMIATDQAISDLYKDKNSEDTGGVDK